MMRDKYSILEKGSQKHLLHWALEYEQSRRKGKNKAIVNSSVRFS